MVKIGILLKQNGPFHCGYLMSVYLWLGENLTKKFGDHFEAAGRGLSNGTGLGGYLPTKLKI